MFSAEVVCHSTSLTGIELITFKLRYPKFIHGEFMTHRVFSRNAASARAVPVKTMIEEVRSDQLRATPIYWGKHAPGMGTQEELTGVARTQAMASWRRAALYAADEAENALRIGGAKEWINRILEPYLHINVVFSTTEPKNFFGLRLDARAQPEMRALAKLIWSAYLASEPTPLNHGEWHLPFVAGIDVNLLSNLIRISTARCARVSYTSFKTQRRSTPDEDIELYEKLKSDGHWSPFEHVATPDRYVTKYVRKEDETHWSGFTAWEHPELHGNFNGWIQHRKEYPDESIRPLPEGYAPPPRWRGSL